MSIYEKLKSFIEQDMSMQHIYQPVMLIELLKNQGNATEETIARVILNRDPTQVDYYIDKVRNMVGEVLRDNGITEREKQVHSLKDYNQLAQEEIEELINLCRDKILEFEDKRGDKIWEHRASDRELISGSVRHLVLNRAARRCEKCGNSEREIDVDHIVPRSLGGANDISNYQALCWLCNTQKGNRDQINFSELEKTYHVREKGCFFCDTQVNKKRVIEENTLAYSIRDAFAVTEHHTLIIPKRHTLDYFNLYQPEINAINQLIKSQKALIDKKDKSVEGYNIGMNCGEVAGQTIFHCHIHLIPRRKGDVENPKGGIRNVIPGKGDYKNEKS
ncbi:HNH nuclease [Candidatus Methylopumilus universalis]|uniref:HIT domain-containing protein n=1 Tax=Candidatus Methylopumilus universalis TaxID=2588536 RepID=UPI003BEEE299